MHELDVRIGRWTERPRCTWRRGARSYCLRCSLGLVGRVFVNATVSNPVCVHPPADPGAPRAGSAIATGSGDHRT
jgi:hypothetical protein